jgi:hypothetical protein
MTVNGQGISIPVGDRTVLGPRSLRLGERFLSLHVNVAGNPGMGKSTFMMHIADEVERRGEMAVILGDPKAEFFQGWYRKDRGDWVIDPASDDCCYWASEEEAIDRARAESWGKSFIPDPPGQDENFFPRNARAALAGLMSRHNIWRSPDDPASCENLARWIGAPEAELMKRIARIPGLSASFNAKAVEQWAGLTGTLAPLAPSFGMMPRKSEGRRKFTVREWASKRDRSWIFFTSTPDTRDASRPVQTAIADNLLRALEEQVIGPRVWIICDELSLMKRMPSLIEAAALLRASGNPLVLGYQNSAQIEMLYGTSGMRALLGMAYTNVCFGTTDAEIQRHMEASFGYAEIERVSQNQPEHAFFGSKHARSASLTSHQVPKDPLIMDSQFGGFPPHIFAIKLMDMVRVERVRKNEHPTLNDYRDREIPEIAEAATPISEADEIVQCDPEEIVECDEVESKKRGRAKKASGQNPLFSSPSHQNEEDE